MTKDKKTDLPIQEDTGKDSGGDVEDFLRKVAATPRRTASQGRGRLVFALDATASRQPTWNAAMDIQAAMFSEAASLGGLEIKLVFYRGFGEMKATPWLNDANELLRRMSKVSCLAGRTQIERLLRHATVLAREGAVNAIVFVGDCVEEDADAIGDAAGELGLLGVPVFVFHEGFNPQAALVFDHMARLTGGACCRFDARAPEQLRDLLRAVAVFAAGGRKALADFGQREGGAALRLTHQFH